MIFDVVVGDGVVDVEVDSPQVNVDVEESVVAVVVVSGEPGLNGLPGPTGLTGAPGATGPAGPIGNLVHEVVPQQLQNGSNATFSLSNLLDTSKTVQVFRNGLLEVPGVGFSATSSSITFSTPPMVTDIVAVIYQKVE
jgi:hypothetical protein